MVQSEVKELDERIAIIDGMDLNRPGRTGIYVIREPELTLVESGPSLSVPYVLAGLKRLNLDPKQVRYIIVTHIHLDHAGGAGLLLQSCPNAKVVVHPRGARHLADPSRLIAGARLVYGEQFDSLFDPVVPIPEERLLVKGEGDQLPIGPNCTLSFMDTPGHAAHHLSFYDPVSKGIFTGDTAGIRFSEVDWQFVIPSTSPNQFDPEAALKSIARYRQLKPERIYFGHYSMTTEVEDALNQVSSWLPRFVEAGKEALAAGEGEKGTMDRLVKMTSEVLSRNGISKDHPIYEIMLIDLKVSAMGIVHYLERQAANKIQE